MAERKKFDKAFKEQTVERILAGEATASSMAKEIGVHYSTIRDWVITYGKDGSNYRFIFRLQIYVKPFKCPEAVTIHFFHVKKAIGVRIKMNFL